MERAPDIVRKAITDLVFIIGIGATVFGIMFICNSDLAEMGKFIIFAGVALAVFASPLVLSFRPSFMIFLAFFVAAFFAQAYIALPFSDTLNIAGFARKLRYNPSSNLVKFVFLIGTPLIGAFCAHFFARRRMPPPPEAPDLATTCVITPPAWRRWTWAVAIAIIVFVAGNYYSYHARPLQIDTFHEGESLAPALNYLAGQVPYRDFLFIHGVVQDPLMSVIGFKLFGKSISSARMVAIILEMTAFTLFTFLLFLLCRRNIFFFGLSLPLLYFVAARGILGMTIPHRGICVLLFLIVLVLLHQRLRHGAGRDRGIGVSLLVFLFGLLPPASFAYSADIGFFLTGALILIAPLVAFTYFSKALGRFSMLLFLGVITGIGVVGAAIKGAYREFFDFVFVTMPRYADLAGGLPYMFDTLYYILPVAAFAFIAYWLFGRFLASVRFSAGQAVISARRFFSAYLPEIAIFIVALIHYKSALGRADDVHRSYASYPLYLLGIYLFMKYGVAPAFKMITDRRRLVALPCVMMAAYLVTSLHGYNFEQWFRFPLGVSDDEVIHPHQKMLITFLKREMKPDENFFTLSSEGAWYYFIDRPCPSRFNTVWFAMPPAYQDEVIRDLETKNVVYILYRNSHWGNKIDGVKNSLKLSKIFAYIDTHYSFYNKIDDNELWIRNGYLPSPDTATEGRGQ